MSALRPQVKEGEQHVWPHPNSHPLAPVQLSALQQNLQVYRKPEETREAATLLQGGRSNI